MTAGNPREQAPIGVMGAMPGETRALIDAIEPSADPIEHGGRVFHFGTLSGRSVVLTTSRCGKVAAGATATELIVRFGVRALVFTGVGGGLGVADGADIGVGDIIIADELVQHDMDASPLFPPHEIPLLGVSRFRTDPTLASAAERAALAQMDRLRHPDLVHREPVLHRGLIASGDQFIASRERRDAILAALPDALCVEMEGAAVAQVAHEYATPVCVVRTVSDLADGSAPGVFQRSLDLIAAEHARALVGALLADPCWDRAAARP